MAERTFVCRDCGATGLSAARGPIPDRCVECRRRRDARRPSRSRAKLTPEERSARASRSAKARWARYIPPPPPPPRPPRFCVECGSQLSARRTKVCSKKCRNRRLSKSDALKQARARWKAKNPGQFKVKNKPCAWCGKLGVRSDADYCSKACGGLAVQERSRRARLPVLHPNPDPLTWLPARHPAMRPPPKRPDWWKFIVNGPCHWCGEQFTVPTADPERLPKFCSKKCARASAKRDDRFRIPPKVRWSIYYRDGWTCQLCGDPVDPTLTRRSPSDCWAATLDHIVPQSRTLVPDHRPENLRLAHRWCNSVRGDESHYTADDLAA